MLPQCQRPHVVIFSFTVLAEMSALGQERTFIEAIPMSAVPPTADIGRTSVELPRRSTNADNLFRSAPESARTVFDCRTRRAGGRAIVGKMAAQRTHQPGYRRLRGLMEPRD